MLGHKNCIRFSTGKIVCLESETTSLASSVFLRHTFAVSCIDTNSLGLKETVNFEMNDEESVVTFQRTCMERYRQSM